MEGTAGAIRALLARCAASSQRGTGDGRDGDGDGGPPAVAAEAGGVASSVTLEWYDAAHEALARSGARVLALAYKRLPDDEADDDDGDDDDENDKNGWAEKDAAGARRRSRPPRPRREVEGSLTFVGFAAFRSHARSDSAATVRALHGEGHLRVAMVTGDATPTALSAAREVRRWSNHLYYNCRHPPRLHIADQDCLRIALAISTFAA